MSKLLQGNAKALQAEMEYFRKILDTRLKLYFGQETEHRDILAIKAPVHKKKSSNWAKWLHQYQPTITERLTVLLALVPHLDPRLLDVFFSKNATFDRAFSEFGGRADQLHQGFQPTGETVLFLVAAGDLEQRITAKQVFSADHYFHQNNILYLDHSTSSAYPMTGLLRLDANFLAQITHGQETKPIFGKDFPAELIQTPLNWSDLVLNKQTLQQIQEIETWIEHGDTLLHDWGMNGRIRSGFRALFHGPPGTGKTVTACLLGKQSGRDVYRIDLSMVVSKYIGETEKNLAKVFQQAENKNWILFFDEADALFGKRTETRSANDRFANQEVAYLLQRIESFSGIVILATNLKNNIDEAFSRRFEAIIHFPMPNANERLRLWKMGFSPKAKMSPEVDLDMIAQRFELSGGAIMNAIRYASLEAIRTKSKVISMRAIQLGIRRELVKEGKVV